MNAAIESLGPTPYARAVAASKRARWDIDRDVLGGRSLDQKHKYLPDGLSLALKDVLMFHWKEESQHAVLDELEWRRADETLGSTERARAVDDLLALVAAVDGILQLQAAADASYFANQLQRRLMVTELASIQDTFLRAYRYQYIGSGIEQTRFPEILFGLVGDAESTRIKAALGPLL